MSSSSTKLIPDILIMKQKSQVRLRECNELLVLLTSPNAFRRPHVFEFSWKWYHDIFSHYQANLSGFQYCDVIKSQIEPGMIERWQMKKMNQSLYSFQTKLSLRSKERCLSYGLSTTFQQVFAKSVPLNLRSDDGYYSRAMYFNAPIEEI